MENFLWHHVTDEEAEKIKEEAKGIMNSFAKAIASVEKESKEIPFVEREDQTREESKEKKSDKAAEKENQEFRDAFFENAPEKTGDYLKAERGKWK